MKKYISIFICAIIFGLTSCDVIKDELGLNDSDKNQNNENKEDQNKEDQGPSQTNVNKSPCAYFTFDGNYNDLSGTDKYAYGNPEPTFVAGPVSGKKAIAFSRANLTKVVINDGLIDSPSMTISFWMKDISEGDIFWVTSSNTYPNTDVMMHLTYTEGHLKYVITRNNHYYSSDYKSTGNYTHKDIADGDWHHIVIVSDYNQRTQDKFTTILYIDGIKMDSLNEDYRATNEEMQDRRHFGTGTKFIIGGDNTPNMKIANLRVYDEWQLPESEIKNLFNKKL